jgi:hypothetical protein
MHRLLRKTLVIAVWLGTVSAGLAFPAPASARWTWSGATGRDGKATPTVVPSTQAGTRSPDDFELYLKRIYEAPRGGRQIPAAPAPSPCPT